MGTTKHHFAVELYAELRRREENLFFSPFSIGQVGLPVVAQLIHLPVVGVMLEIGANDAS